MKVVPLVAVVAACCLSAFCGDSTGSSYPSLRGNYNASFRFVEIMTSSGQSGSVVCPGTLNIFSQSGSAFSGSFTIEETQTCASQRAGTLSGSVASDGLLTFTTSESGTGRNAIAMLASNCSVTSGSDEFHGRCDGDGIIASMDAQLRCGGPTGIDMELQIHIVALKP